MSDYAPGHSCLTGLSLVISGLLANLVRSFCLTVNNELLRPAPLLLSHTHHQLCLYFLLFIPTYSYVTLYNFQLEVQSAGNEMRERARIEEEGRALQRVPPSY